METGPSDMMLIRDMKVEDIPQIMIIEKACYDETWEDAHFLFQLHHPDPCNWVAVSDGLICAYINCCKWNNELHLNNLAVLEEHRKKGVAQSLLGHMEEYAKERKLKIIKLEVNENNHAALELYNKNGFIRTGYIPDYYDNESSAALIMSKQLEKK
jgi:[ribosomal protein S18]-alanine N-acetyltransferase